MIVVICRYRYILNKSHFRKQNTFKVYVDRNTIQVSQNLSSGLFLEEFSYKLFRESTYFSNIPLVDLGDVFAFWAVFVTSQKLQNEDWIVEVSLSHILHAQNLFKNSFHERYLSYRRQSIVDVQLLIEWFSISYEFVLSYILKPVTRQMTVDQARSLYARLDHHRLGQITLRSVQITLKQDRSDKPWTRHSHPRLGYSYSQGISNYFQF